MWINTAIIWMLIFFMIVGIGDKALGNKRGYGKAFDEGFQTMGPLAIVMVGMITVAPILAEGLRPLLTPAFLWLGADPAMFSGMILAVDMGGYPLAFELASSQEAAKFSGIILATMLGPTFVFTVPVALGLISNKHYPLLARGIMLGLIPVPVGAFLAGSLAGYSPVFIGQQLIPVFIFTGIVIVGLLLIEEVMIRCFIFIGKVMMLLVTSVLVVVAIQELAGVTLIRGLTPFAESMEIVGLIVLALGGAFPFVHFLQRRVIPLCSNIIDKSGIEAGTWIGLIASLAHSIPMYKKLDDLDNRGKLMNIAFSVSGAFVFGGHLAFTAAVEPTLVFPMIIGKLSAGILAVILAYMLSARLLR
ncbi:ethanolamine utilization protein EutH [Salipaludibacillus agaradhaerens]|uniref:ethanolamine utilization protein EutH n=1 Tax=Salipaludibacillus agaradhaerens TaxID=76935 RepID=UPI00215158C9|nr:ethanolamine utilization protein EutH [Salipaludibacillus agaradhaerens]MCR6106047.1 ethanolamine utilization protein EutH [Salipaludibacillus agaradhaerens]MCR6118080.1 ethanolamine utilization protein EutH [Salipaludibacillus agaradhaerens]